MWGKDGLAGAQEPKKLLDPAKPGEQLDGQKPPAQTKKQGEPEMPKGLTPEAQNRFRHLVGEVKKERNEREQHQQRAEVAEKRANEFVGIMRESGVTPDDFAGFCETIQAWRSGNYDLAAQRLLAQLREVSIAAGRNYTGSDILSEFPDLAEKVAQMQISEDDAIKLARANRLETGITRHRDAQVQQNQQVGEWKQAKEVAVSTVGKMVSHWKANDIDFARKEAKLAAKMARLGTVHPSQWPAKVKEMYEDITEAATAFGTPPAGKAGPRPLSGGGAPSRTSKAPQSAYEAMWGTPKPA
jgi:hypothetical protein